MWHEGTIGVPKKEGGYMVVHYWVKAYDAGSQYGIDGGRISKSNAEDQRRGDLQLRPGAGYSAAERGSGNGAGDPDARIQLKTRRRLPNGSRFPILFIILFAPHECSFMIYIQNCIGYEM